jgi:hypothetical protein
MHIIERSERIIMQTSAQTQQLNLSVKEIIELRPIL